VIFLTYWFWVFAAIALPFYWLVPRPGVRLPLLVLTCAVFHTKFAGPAGVLPILVLGTLTYAIGLSRRRRLCVFGMVLCVAALSFYKYAGFFAGEIVGAFSARAGEALLSGSKGLMPAGPPLAISFFTFEFVHYLYDVRAGAPPIVGPLRFAAFAIFWPSIVAGPVKRYQQFLPALDRGLEVVTRPEVAYGLIRVAVGLVKKFTADNLTAYVDFWDDQFAAVSLVTRWYVFFGIGLRILLDFSGYSDMAIGFARMLGVRLPENFAWPYLATSVRDFWQRWHISLSQWIRDYVYIPLGGGRGGVASRVTNGLVAFAVCGLWHGPAWNFVAWGLYHGAGLGISSTYRTGLGRVGARFGVVLDQAPVLSWAVTFAFVMAGWLLFFYPVSQALKMLRLLVYAD
jgi:alginate O-acetyltransferase complex protein AlgI